VDEMKIQTMYKMVCDCTVKQRGKSVSKKVLYLTNKQASLFDDQAMARCIQALDLGDPKFVINLLPSLGNQMRKAHKEKANHPEGQYLDSTYLSSEICELDERITETQILVFMKTCILPIAMQTKALILVGGTDDCSLSSALAHAVLAEQARLGNDCPFTVVTMTSEFEVHYNALNTKRSISAQVAKNCPAWLRRISIIQKTLENQNISVFPQCDLSAAATRYIIFESINEETMTIDSSLERSFASTFLQWITQKLPSIAIQANYPDDGVSHLIDLAIRGIPVLLLDTFERAVTYCLPEKERPNTILAKESKAFPSVPMDFLKSLQISPLEGNLTVQSRKEIMKIAMDMIERKCFVQISYGTVDKYESAMLAFFHSALLLGSKNITKSKPGVICLGEKILQMEKLSRANKEHTQKSSLVPVELASFVINFLQMRIDALNKQAALSRVNKWLEKSSNTTIHKNEEDLSLAAKEEKEMNNSILSEKALLYQKKLQHECVKIQENNGFLLSSEVNSTQWLALLDVFTNKNFYSSSIHDIDYVKRLISSIGKIDRLPDSNSLQALKTLQNAWDHVELYHSIAYRYKIVSKVAYIVLLILGIAVTVLSILSAKNTLDAKIPIIIISFCTTIAVAFVTFTNPALRWQQLRMAALTIESNIFTFRTRSGAYRAERNDLHSGSSGQSGNSGGIGANKENYAEKLLKDILSEIKNSVLEGADIKNTPFYSYKMKSLNLHGQHNSEEEEEETMSMNAKSNNVHPERKQKKKEIRMKPQKISYASFSIHNNDVQNKMNKIIPLPFPLPTQQKQPQQQQPLYGQQAIKQAIVQKKAEVSSAIVDQMNSTVVNFMTTTGDQINTNYQQLLTTNDKEEDGEEEKIGSDNMNNNDKNRPQQQQLDTASVPDPQSMNALLYPQNENNINIYNSSVEEEEEEEEDDNPEDALSSPTASSMVSVYDVLPPHKQNRKSFRFDELASLLDNGNGEDEDEEIEARHEIPDNHYDPLTPDLYIKYRIQPMLIFYQKRIPVCYRIRIVSQSFLVIGAILFGALAYFDLSSWTSIVTIVTAAVTAFIEFHGTNNKIDRYSYTVHSLQELIIWWETLPQIDRSVVWNIDRLICSAEDLIQREQQAWKSTSQAVKMLQKTAKSMKNDGGNVGDDGKKEE
jgi:hypothetical protein